MNTYSSYWDKICQIYLLTKHYLLLAEEISDDFDTFLQPLKEHRDALDHIVRAYGYRFLENPPNDIDQYCNSNMKKALGHGYRAFFDTADWLSYICRKKIREILEGKEYDDICAVYPQYSQIKQTLSKLPADIAVIRENKDVSDDEDGLIQEVNKYKLILDTVIDAYMSLNNLF